MFTISEQILAVLCVTSISCMALSGSHVIICIVSQFFTESAETAWCSVHVLNILKCICRYPNASTNKSGPPGTFTFK